MDERTVDTGTDVLRAQVRDRMGIITFTRAERRNALHRDMYAPFAAAMEDFAGAPDVGCIVLTGDGPAFCAGGDVRDGRPKGPDGRSLSFDERVAALSGDARTSVLLHESPKLTIAAVNGPAVGAGMSLALACDLRILARSARLVTGWARLAFSGDFGGSWFLTRLVGPARALELLAANSSVDADEALALGLANRVVDDEGFAESWAQFARTFAHGPVEAIALMKQNVQAATHLQLGPALALETANMVRSSGTADHREAVRAWLDKRPPDFTGNR